MDVINPYGKKYFEVLFETWRRGFLLSWFNCFKIVGHFQVKIWAITWSFKIYIGEVHMGYTQGSCRHFELEPIHLGFTFNQFKSQNGFAFMSTWPKFDN
jgi:hypothetical protein